MFIDKKLLKKNGACKQHRQLFKQTFPNGTDVTQESLAKAREVGLMCLGC